MGSADRPTPSRPSVTDSPTTPRTPSCLGCVHHSASARRRKPTPTPLATARDLTCSAFGLRARCDRTRRSFRRCASASARCAHARRRTAMAREEAHRPPAPRASALPRRHRRRRRRSRSTRRPPRRRRRRRRRWETARERPPWCAPSRLLTPVLARCACGFCVLRAAMTPWRTQPRRTAPSPTAHRQVRSRSRLRNSSLRRPKKLPAPPAPRSSAGDPSRAAPAADGRASSAGRAPALHGGEAAALGGSATSAYSASATAASGG